MTAYYNEIDPYCAEWLRNLAAEGLIPPGEVDERSIEDVKPDEIKSFTQAHFFAGIGGWPLAARMAGWPDDRPLWTGSCPCQPFSNAGKRLAYSDPRNLWPDFARLIADCRPPAVAGEQVASKAGRLWLAGVRADLEALGYGVGAADLCAAGVSAPHLRQRLWWVADADGRSVAGGCSEGGLGHAGGEGRQERERDRRVQREAGQPPAGQAAELPGNPWADAVWLPCADGKARRIEPGIEPLVDGFPCRVDRVRAYGNSICPQEAAEFLTAFIGST